MITNTKELFIYKGFWGLTKRVRNMNVKSCIVFIMGIFFAFYAHGQGATCNANYSSGTNLVTNYDFSQGYAGWTYDATQYTAFTACGSSCYSVPGKIYVGTNPGQFNAAFTSPMADHTGTADNTFLMVDGVCTPNINLWKQTVTISANTNYFFSVWVTSLDATSSSQPATLQFVINGSVQVGTITANQTPGTWQQYTVIWNSGAVSGAIPIEIQNITTLNCSTGVDFGVDDITFTPGCQFGSPGPTPNLGPDITICGKTTPFNINPNFPLATQNSNNVHYYWYLNGAPVTNGTGPSFYNLSVSAGGTYQVCVDSSGSCTKSDVLVISTTYTVNLGGPYTLCNPATQLLNAVYTGPGVTYQWYKNGTVAADTIQGAKSSTYNVTSAGTYYVIVHDPICGNVTASAVVTSNAPTPVNTTFCPSPSGSGNATFSVTGGGTYYWYSSATAPNNPALAGPTNTYNATGLTGAGPYTFYAQDSTPTAGTAGPPATGNGFTGLYGVNPGATNGLMVFNALTPFTLNSISVLPYNYYCAAGVNDSIGIQITNSAGVNLPGSPVIIGVPCNCACQPEPAVVVPLNINIPVGTGYKISTLTQAASGKGSHLVTIGGYLNGTGAGGNQPSPQLYTYPTTYSGAVSFVSNSAHDFTLYYNPDAFPGYFNWNITKYSSCARVPVIATKSCPLPVQFIYFDAMVVGNNVNLSWETATEKNANIFNIERSSDGINYLTIGKVSAIGNSTSIRTYNFTDNNPLQQKSYYRIAEQDIDGDINYTPIRTIEYAVSAPEIRPNPTSGIITLSYNSEINLLQELKVYNLVGNEVYHIKIDENQKYVNETINISDQPDGVYFLVFHSGEKGWTYKIIKQ
jgi:hypothetical protein